MDYSDSDEFTMEDTVSHSITESLGSFLNHSAYACGGIVEIQAQSQPLTHGRSLPVTIRWNMDEVNERLTLPLDPSISGSTHGGISKLVAATEPASFGFQGENVIDETYRKATKLDPGTFSTNFCPYEAGIIDVVSQTLLPMPTTTSQGIRAELYKLNIYQAPSGHFKPHVDTPRSQLHFGSLVVCLPLDHEGGQLVVKHKSHATTFDWSGSELNIQWAAFYSDCEHEVLQVTSGHRVTLTYNLYVRRGLGEIAGLSPVHDARQLPAFNATKAALANPLFFPEGLLSKYCSHPYAHSTALGISCLPQVLKGSDMVTYEVFRSLSLDVHVKSVLKLDEFEEELQEHRDSMLEDDDYDDRHVDYVSNLSKIITTDCSTEEDPLDVVFEYGFSHTKHKMKWLNAPPPMGEDLQFMWLRYGNMASIDYAYSFCALIVEIPPYAKRLEIAKKSGYTLDQVSAEEAK